jgi:hemoglobin-like flavoprotein
MSLSPKTIATVKATVPALQEHAVAITSAMYDIMFEKHPELKTLFKDAPKDQPKILATAVQAYAMNIDNLDALTAAVESIAKAHVHSQVKPEHYPIVGESILAALSKVLGDAATPDILEAWGEAYFFLADLLIAKEKALYAAT